MQPTTPSCTAVIATIVLIIAFSLLGIAALVQREDDRQQVFEQTANAIYATNTQVSVFISQTEQARSITPTPTN
ncbi:MAG: hypothetical protein KF716_05685 [Anaerolineae bacterium]|nr:hypothetical protein [Anaerolineae bacterium]